MHQDEIKFERDALCQKLKFIRHLKTCVFDVTVYNAGKVTVHDVPSSVIFIDAHVV